MLEALFGYQFHPSHVAIFLTLIYLEAVLSFDNAAVLGAMVRPLPGALRQKALLYGLIGAYVFRITAILFAAFIIENPFLKFIGGAYLVFLPVKHFWPSGNHDPDKPRGPSKLPFLNVFWSTVVMVELLDIAFALDQVLVAVALTDELLIIIVAAMIAIVFLRIAAGYMARIMDWFPTLEGLAYLAVGFVGLRLLYEEALVHYGLCDAWPLCPVPKELAIAATLLLLVVPVIGKVLYDRFTAARA